MSHGWFTCNCGKHYHKTEHQSGNCPSCSDKVVSLSLHKAKLTNEIKLSNALRDTEAYTNVIHKSLNDWHTYSVQEKAELYKTVALFNLELLRQLIDKMNDASE